MPFQTNDRRGNEEGGAVGVELERSVTLLGQE